MLLSCHVVMNEDVESSDIPASQLAAIQSKGQFQRSISLALSAETGGDFLPSCSVEQDDRGHSLGISADNVARSAEGLDIASTIKEEDHDLEDRVERRVLEEDGEDEAVSDDATTEESVSSDDDSDAVQMAPLPQSTVSNHRRRTQLQRQRLRQQKRDFFAPFIEDDDLHLSCEGTVEIENRQQWVPTLMELCMEKGFSTTTPLPPGLKPALSQHRGKARLAALQLRWLGRNLAILEKQIKWNLVEALGPHGVKSTHLRRDAKSLWRRKHWHYEWSPHPERKLWILPASCQVYDTTDWKIAALAHYISLALPHWSVDSKRDGASQSEHKGCWDTDIHVQQVKRCLRKRYPKLVKYCFDHAMAYVWWTRGRCTKAQESFIKIAKRYPPDLISETEQSTLWARHRAMVLVEIGRLMVSFDQPDSAGKFFREAAEVASRKVHPGIADKLTLQSLALTASAYDQGMMAGHSAIQAARLWSVTAQQVQAVEQTPERTLLYYEWADRGEPVPEYGCREAVLAAVESLLHCHAGHVVDPASQDCQDSLHRNRVWLTGAKANLEKLQGPESAFVGLYLSFVHAMLNEARDAEIAYHHSLTSNIWRGEPGDVWRGEVGNVATVLRETEVRPHPWWLFGEWIAARKAALGKSFSEPLRVLPLVWRRGLQQPAYRFDGRTLRKQIADIEGLTLDLHVTPKGHLTGAMMQNLPPMTKVCMDAYTGQVHLGGACCNDELHRWDNYDNSFTCKVSFDCNSNVPQSNIIYSDPKTSTVTTLVINSMSRYYELEADSHAQMVAGKKCPENLRWIQRESQVAISIVYQRAGLARVKVNIVDLVLKERKKSILDAINSSYDARLMKEADNFLDFCVRRQYDFHEKNVTRFLKLRRTDGNMGQPESQHRLATKREMAKFVEGEMERHNILMMRMILKKVLYVGKATVVLLLTMWSHDVFVFIDCTSAESFSQPVLRRTNEMGMIWYGSLHNRWNLPSDCSCWSAPNPTASLLFAFDNDLEERPGPYLSHFMMKMFDEKGNALSFETFANRGEQDASKARYFLSCEGHKIIGTNKEKTKVTVCDLEKQTELWSSELTSILKLDMAKGTVYVSTREGLFALDINTLKPLVIIHLRSSRFMAPPNDNGLLLNLPAGSADYLKVLSTNEVMTRIDGTEQGNRTFLGMDNHVLLLRRHKMDEGDLLKGEQKPDVLEMKDVMVPGRPKELCYLSKQAGFVVSATISSRHESSPYYRESLYWFDMDGDIIAIHPFIGGGHHSFLPVYLRDPGGDGEGKADDRDLYLYFADGLGALCCIKLDIYQYR
ncbi:uncharacterized protein LOC110988270 isoform X2 [Acanthaster planci]|uniref:Uncharacterized protein LOC110988270 isoform X2 n=1 Tax=Acanthaster planci TaxID=133434 RepID=A0A8B7ZUX2_ACAPL|nr:uncharacterized protein LOC110988270 isoform X2 [Acanthaster planci]